MSSLPLNVHVSKHPSLLAKLSQLRSKSTGARDVKTLIHEISLILASEALPTAIAPAHGPKDQTPLGFEYTTTVVSPGTICIVPILRSGLGMVEAVQTMLPSPVPVHHLGMYREMTTLDPVEYYNNLPHHIPTSDADPSGSALAIVVDPIVATGGTCAAAISTLREWGARHILVLSVVGAEEGVRKAAGEWPEGTDLWFAGVDGELTKEGMLKPGLGDVGDRLFLTIGK
ncbi:Uracil phosphoribosyltransferase-like protein [Hapsidospora chrysogenum ATCC 11550]|uniref:uracil phosphoribosyltransferase n=1 Tax=Hapsidospora chrysogenum (strain ATCC 11550 / CBS 779.69 / DSM 880 / IAM 14645 / JCM 23072 / IMI 49137) TaxID=857340 RepID=A0A086TGQ5_HAPC1|nr:Uracil phosphoribosyltransferase-like protein [Hapsidospora chrysogenum ATCC 11550]